MEDLEKTAHLEKRRLRKIVKDSMSNLSFLKISGTSLAAVSMALISARLTSVVSSLILVAIVSVGTAVLSEVYKVILSATSLGAKKVIKPVLKIQKVDEATGEIHLVEDEKVVEQPETEPPLSFRSLLSHLWSNHIIRMVTLFAFVSTLTIMTSYFVSNATSEGKTTYTSITQPIQGLSEKEKDAITSDAERKASDAASSTDEKVAQLEKENDSLQSQLNDAQQKNTDQDATIQDLKNSIETLQKQQKAIEESQPSGNAATPAPEPSPSSSPTESPSNKSEGTTDNGTNKSSNGETPSNQQSPTNR